MAVSLQDANLVAQKVKHALADANPVAAQAFKSLHTYLATQKGNPQLQFFPFSEAQADTAGGTALLSGASVVYGWYVKKTGTATTANTTKIFDDATDDSTTTDQRLSLITSAAAQEAFEVYPHGFTLATGIVITQHTTVEGGTDGSDGCDGFIIVGS